VGVGVAELGARRGFKVALVERVDFASGTSSAYSKLVHGGSAACGWASSVSCAERLDLRHL